MRVERLTIKGIDRNVGSPDNDDGYCSELINIKPQNGLKVVGNKVVKSANIPYTDIKIHKIGKVSNYIGIKDDATGVGIYHFNPESGAYIKEIDKFPAGTDIEYTLLNNQLVISDRTNIKLYVWQFKDEYVKMYDGLDFDVNIDIVTDMYTNESEELSISAVSEEQYLAGCQSALNKFKSMNKNFCEGYFQYAFTVTLYDGTETGVFGHRVYSTLLYNRTGGDGYGGLFRPTQIENENSIKTTFFWKSIFYSPKISHGGNDFSRYKDIIKKVNLYVSKPISRFQFTPENTDITGVAWKNGKLSQTQPEELFWATIKPVKIKDSGAEKDLLYRQKSWTLDEFSKAFEYTLEFGGDIQTTGATMEVYASDLDRAGKMYTYNNRVHFYDSVVRLKPKLGSMLSPYATGKTTVDVYVCLRTSNQENVLKYSDVEIGTIASDSSTYAYKFYLPDMVVFPDSRAYKMLIVEKDTESIDGFDGAGVTIDLTSSPAYNYAYFFGGETYDAKSDMIANIPEVSDTYEETNAINVTATSNPMVFPVEHSYRFDGNITALSVSTQSISDVQVGQWPLIVFTDNGIYALEQGNGAVLYSNIVPISNDTCTNENIVNTRQGIAYISNSAVYLLAGRNTTKLSLLLEGDIDTNIQNNPSFLKCCSNSLYDITGFLSSEPFKQFVDNAKLSWCANTNELIVSSADYPYSYVYDFVYNQWYKTSGSYTMIENNMMLSSVLEDNPARVAKATISLHATIEKPQYINSVSSVAYNTSHPGGRSGIAMFIDNEEVAIFSFQEHTSASMIISTLCSQVDYLQEYNGTIYSTTNLDGKSILVHCLDVHAENSILLSSTFSSDVQSIQTAGKAIGSEVSVKVNDNTYTTQILEDSTDESILNELMKSLNNDENVTAEIKLGFLMLSAREAGKAGNSIKVSVSATDDVNVNVKASEMTGGRGAGIFPTDDNRIVDWSSNDTNADTIVHLHTRPIHLQNKNAYKTIRQMILNCMCQLSDDNNLSVYLYASNNLIDWKCVSAAQRKNCNIAQITTDRVDKAYKYFVIMIGGKVNSKTQLSDIFISLQDVANSKPR